VLHRRELRLRRHRRVRKKVAGTAQRPRLSVFRSGRHMYAQVIDDVRGQTLAAASTLEAAFRGGGGSTATVDAARRVGELVAQRALEAGIRQVVFDRGGYLYHGRVAAVAEGARAAGLDL
jgi:large subunit ribosomal protein L18